MRSAKIAAGVGIAALVGAGAIFLVRPRTWDVAPLAIAANPASVAVARGEEIFAASCLECHLDPATGKAAGRGHAANLTRHADGIADMPDGVIARVVRTGVRADGRLADGMPRFPAMSDADVGALLGWLRSTPPPSVLEPVAGRRPPSVMGGAGKPALEGAKSVPPPALRETLAYGAYLAEIYRCRDCHTREDGERNAGGRVFEVAGGAIVSTNLTPSRGNGLGEWRPADLVRALRDGIGRDGSILRFPMPRLRRASDEEIGALYAYLLSQPPSEQPMPEVANLVPREKAPAAGAKPEELFLRLGCPSCHAQGAPYAVKIRQAKGKSVAEVATWIRNPQAKVPGTPMPTFATLIDDEQSQALAAWVLAKLDEGKPF